MWYLCGIKVIFKIYVRVLFEHKLDIFVALGMNSPGEPIITSASPGDPYSIGKLTKSIGHYISFFKHQITLIYWDT